MMRAPHFFRLAEIDERRFINACRHGLIHLTWTRITVRLSRDEFRRLAGLLARSTDALPPGTVRDGSLQLTYSEEGDCELQLGPVKLAISSKDFRALDGAVREAVEQLDEILESGIWDREEPKEAPPTIIEHFRRHRFSEN
jgi:hypothetical protein